MGNLLSWKEAIKQAPRLEFGKSTSAIFRPDKTLDGRSTEIA